MSYLDRLRPCKYTSPSGKSFTLLYEDVEKQAEKKAAIHETASGDGAIVQDLGRKSKQYPLTLYVVGVDYDKTADAFAAALDETYTPETPGKLQHPRWGLLDVFAPSYTQTEKLVDEMMCAVFTVPFVHAPNLALSSSTTTPAAIQSAADTTAALNVTDKVATLAADVAKVKKAIKSTAKAWTKGLRTITGMTDTIRTEIVSLGTTIESSIDTLVEAPADLCDSLISLARLPAQLDTEIKAKVSSYSALVTDLVDRLTSSTSGETATTETQAAIASVSLVSLGIAALESASVGDLTSRDDAVTVASDLADLIATIRIQLDDLLSLYEIPPELLDDLAILSANVQAYLLDQSYSLRTVRKYTLTKDAFLLQLIRDLMGEVSDLDDTLDDFIALNHLGCDSLLTVPRGTEVLYYVG